MLYAYTQIVIQQWGNGTRVEVHRSKRSRVWYYHSYKLTVAQQMRLYRVLSLSVWDQSVEFSYDLSSVVTLSADKPVFSRKNRRVVEESK